MRRLRVRPSQPGLRGPRESLPGPTTWVRPATGWWERMNAGETPPNQGRSVKAAPVRFQKAVPRTKEKRRGEAPKGAPVRVMGRPFPPAGGTGPTVRRATGCGVPHQRLSALRPLGLGHIPRRRPGARSPGTMARGSMETTMSTRVFQRRAFWRNEPELFAVQGLLPIWLCTWVCRRMSQFASYLGVAIA